MATSQGQLLLDGLRETRPIAVSITRGDDKELIIAHDLDAAAIQSAHLIVRVTTADDSGQPVLELNDSDHSAQWNHADGQTTVAIVEANTKTLPVGQYQIAVELLDLTGAVYTPVKGTFTVDWDGVHDSANVGYPSFATLGAIQGQMTALLVSCSAALVTVAAAAGAGTLTVADGSLFADGDTIWVYYDGAAYEAHEIDTDGVDGDELTLVGTLANDVPVGAVVQIEATA